MKILYSLIIVGFALSSIGFLTSDAYGAGFIKFDGIDGESLDKDHKGWSDILSFTETYATTSGSLSVRGGNAISDEVVIVKQLDKSSPKLSEAISEGKVFPKVSINLCSNPNTSCSLTYVLTNVMITSYSISGSADDVPVEDITLYFEKIIRNPQSDSQTKTKDDKTTDESIMKPKPRVPEWVQSTAKFWVDRNVSDREFTDALGFLVKEKIIDVQVEPQLSEKDETVDEEPQIPAWISQTTDWWINGEVPEDQFLEGIKWMIKNRVIRGI